MNYRIMMKDKTEIDVYADYLTTQSGMLTFKKNKASHNEYPEIVKIIASDVWETVTPIIDVAG